MMKKVEDLNYYELLEVSPTASTQEIHKAYERVRRVYEPNSVALYSLFTPEETSAIHQRIEEAYRTLIYEDNRRRYDALLRERHEMPDMPPLPPPAMPKYQPRPAPSSSFTPPLPDCTFESPAQQPQAAQAPAEPPREEISPVSQLIAEFTGSAIKLLREQKNLSLRAISDITKVSTRYLEFIEEENFQKLPARAYVRGFLVMYAKALGCDPERVTADYLKRYDEATGFPHSLRRKQEE
ncbi:MAG TPA: helix-turn-helix domain-containing protein [Nitrospirota bacterium]